MDDDRILSEQVEYYRARAGEYDEWFLRQGRYDRGAAHRDEWFAEVGVAERAVKDWLPEGDILELACGTGLWTRHIATPGRRVVAVDAAPEVLALNRKRVASDRVTYVVADLFSWQPPRESFDAVFFGFWLSHVPESRFEDFWCLVGSALRPGGPAIFVDSQRAQYSTALNHGPLDDSGVSERLLNDGRSFRIVKVFHEAADLESRLARLGWVGEVRTTRQFFLYGKVVSTKQSGSFDIR